MMHSFHLALLPPALTLRTLRRGPRAAGLRHAECFPLMRLGSPVLSVERMQLRRLAMFAEWDDASALERFLADDDLGRRLADGWHVRLQYLRRYGEVAALAGLPVQAGRSDPEEPIVAVTLARLKLLELPRFLKWGRPVERLVAGHPGATFATAAMRPPHTFSTFTIWRSVREMTDMVHGRSAVPQAHTHNVAMAEQHRRDFHHESAFMRFRPLSEHGTWEGRSLLP
ncbi:hypothetical protein C1I93_13985 [Micromonospora endophytica]|uniref:Spheroidene monooxygenase n=2 Tax=Micromonospora endophytica TaxID=515350 RepID=A0A2W2D726_9ACTN|nr:hypothetical protein [Micromonospora endophytica]PZF96409.1 hypothetical protein C1I93_13985 [Micromonospora endophytica]RIW47874.1 hypothetical protein D3H59_08280 [Micromonospora endophytica]